MGSLFLILFVLSWLPDAPVELPQWSHIFFFIFCISCVIAGIRRKVRRS
jgi:hypothetical protein